MMQKPQANEQKMAACNSLRLPEFQTHTVIAEENGTKVVRKYALSKEALPFLKIILERERKNVDYLKGHFEVLCGALKDNRIEYEYLPYQSLAAKIAGYLRRGNYRSANELFQDYVNRLHSLPKVQTVPEEFFTNIVKGDNYSKSEIDCLSRGLLDLTPDNILVNGTRWIVLDNEWSFDFPAPTVFVLFRAVRVGAIMLQSDIRRATSPGNPACCLFARSLNKYYVPTAWKTHLAASQISLCEMLRWEMGFQCYVTGSIPGTIGRIARQQRIHYNLSSRKLADGISFLGKLARAVKAVPGARKVLHLLERGSRFDKKNRR